MTDIPGQLATDDTDIGANKEQLYMEDPALEDSVGSPMCVKLVSGLDLIGIVKGEHEDFMILGNPHILQVVQTQRGPALNFIPFYMFAAKGMDTDLEIWNSQYLGAPYAPEQQVADQFIQVTSGIVIARGNVDAAAGKSSIIQPN